MHKPHLLPELLGMVLGTWTWLELAHRADTLLVAMAGGLVTRIGIWLGGYILHKLFPEHAHRSLNAEARKRLSNYRHAGGKGRRR